MGRRGAHGEPAIDVDARTVSQSAQMVSVAWSPASRVPETGAMNASIRTWVVDSDPQPRPVGSLNGVDSLTWVAESDRLLLVTR